MSFTAGLGAYLQTGLILLAAACLLPSRLRARRGFRIAAPSLLFPAVFMPLSGADLAGHVYAYTGALSLPSLLLLADFTAHQLAWWRPLPERERRTILFGASLAALFLYPMALGFGPFDPYALGYSGSTLPLILGLGAALAWWRGRRWTAVLLVTVMWAWLLELGESQNLWDYLLDAWLGWYAIFWMLLAPIRTKSLPRSCGTS